MLEVWNKIDLLDEANRQRLLAEADAPTVAISAVTGEGIGALAALIEERLSGALETMAVSLRADQLRLIDWLYQNGDVVARKDREDGGVSLTMKVTASSRAEIEARLAGRH